MANRGRKIDTPQDRNYNIDLCRARLGPKPFKTGISYYSVRKEAYLTQSTIQENVRKLLMFADIFEELKKGKRVQSTDPRHISELDVEAFLVWMKQNKLENSTKRKYISLLNSYLGFFGNHVISDMKRQNKLIFVTRAQESDPDFIEEEDLKKLFSYVRNYSGYKGIVIRGYFALIFGVAGRPKEIINGLVEDIDLEEEVFYVRHPKGEGSWGKSEWIPIIRGDMIPLIRTFLNERAEYLISKGIESDYLFPNISTMQPYSGNTIRRYKEEIEAGTGIDFKLKDFRSTYATITYKHAPEMKEAISKQMRHESSRTTEKYYISYDNREAAKLLKDEWKKSKIV